MSRLVHLSDLHFGRTAPELLEPLLHQVAGLQPSLVVISGDLTQRARHGQFAEAAAFIARLGRPALCVPGNHDTPLDNLFVRLFNPFGRYRRHIAADLAPSFQTDAMVVAGVNTANPLAWKRGKITPAQVDSLAIRFADAGTRTRVAVMHHPLEHLPGSDDTLMRGAEAALARMPQAGAEIVLSGHIHTSHIAPFLQAPGMLFVQAGTSLSTRTRSERNAFNVLDVAPGRVEVRAFTADAQGVFRFNDTARFDRRDNAWSRAADQLPR